MEKTLLVEVLWERLGVFLAALGAASRGPSRDLSGVLSGVSGRILETSRGKSGGSWGALGPSWNGLGLSSGGLGRSWVVFRRLGIVLEYLGAS